MRLILLNLWRKPLRTLLTVFGVAVALFLFCLIEAMLNAFNAGVNAADASRLVVQQKESITFTLPASHMSQILQIPGVKRVSIMTWFGGPYEEPLPDGGVKREEFFAQFGVDMETWFPLYPEAEVPAAQMRDALEDRQGCILGDKLAARIGKKTGDRMVLKGAIWPRADGKPWEFNVRGLYTSKSATFDRTMMIFHHKYLDEGRRYAKDRVGIFALGIEDPNRYAQVSAAIDARFANSPNETRTMSEKAFNMQFVSMLGNLKLLFRSIGSVVVVTMLLVSANTMMMNGRERTRDMGVLKAIGFSDGTVFLLLIGEACAISAAGAVLGAGSAYGIFNLLCFNPMPSFFPVFLIPGSSALAALGIAALTGVLSGIVPALAGLRLKATEALRSV